MAIVVAINNYNYEAFIAECVHSVVSQTLAPERVIVVDDGSSDNSVDVIRELEMADDRLQAVFKVNGGQLSCFNAAMPYIKPEDIVFFLDSDDTYPEDYLETMVQHLAPGIDALIAKPVLFGTDHGPPLAQAGTTELPKVTIYSATAMMLEWQLWLGAAATSGFCVRGRMLNRILPYSDEPGWRICADNVLYFGSFFLGESVRFLPGVRFNYRVHGQNHWFGVRDPEVLERKRVATERLFAWLHSQRTDRDALPRGVRGLLRAWGDYLSLPAPQRRLVGIPKAHALMHRSLRGRWLERGRKVGV